MANSPAIGRPLARTEENRAAIIEYTRKGYTRNMAAAAAGIGYSTLMAWTASDQDFRDEIARADHEAAGILYEQLLARSEAARDWRGPAWILERRHPDDWGKRDTLQVEHSGTVRHELAAADPGKLGAALALLRGGTEEGEVVDAEEWITLAEAAEEGE